MTSPQSPWVLLSCLKARVSSSALFWAAMLWRMILLHLFDGFLEGFDDGVDVAGGGRGEFLLAAFEHFVGGVEYLFLDHADGALEALLEGACVGLVAAFLLVDEFLVCLTGLVEHLLVAAAHLLGHGFGVVVFGGLEGAFGVGLYGLDGLFGLCFLVVEACGIVAGELCDASLVLLACLVEALREILRFGLPSGFLGREACFGGLLLLTEAGGSAVGDEQYCQQAGDDDG